MAVVSTQQRSGVGGQAHCGGAQRVGPSVATLNTQRLETLMLKLYDNRTLLPPPCHRQARASTSPSRAEIKTYTDVHYREVDRCAPLYVVDTALLTGQHQCTSAPPPPAATRLESWLVVL